MVQHVSFTYPDGSVIYKVATTSVYGAILTHLQDLDFGIDLDSRIALVGPNG